MAKIVVVTGDVTQPLLAFDLSAVDYLLNPERIEQKIFHAEIVVDNDKVAAETKAYKKIPEILPFTDEHGTDQMKQEIENNYKQIKSEILNIVVSEVERIKNDPNLQHLVQ